MGDANVQELVTDEQIKSAYPVMSQLRDLDERSYLSLVDRMRKDRNYRLFAWQSEDDEIRAVAGIVVQTNLAHGRYAWLIDLVVDEPYRNEGIGTQLLAWLESWAEACGCNCLELPSGVSREAAHRFYERQGMEKFCFTFKKELEPG